MHRARRAATKSSGLGQENNARGQSAVQYKRARRGLGNNPDLHIAQGTAPEPSVQDQRNAGWISGRARDTELILGAKLQSCFYLIHLAQSTRWVAAPFNSSLSATPMCRVRLTGASPGRSSMRAGANAGTDAGYSTLTPLALLSVSTRPAVASSSSHTKMALATILVRKKQYFFMDVLNSRLTSLGDFQAVQTLLSKAIATEAELESKARCPLLIPLNSMHQIAGLDENICQLESNLRAEHAAVQSAHGTLRVSSDALVAKLLVTVLRNRESYGHRERAPLTEIAQDLQAKMDSLEWTEKLLSYMSVVHEVNLHWFATHSRPPDGSWRA